MPDAGGRCENCQKPGSRTYTRAGRTLLLCDGCLDRYELQDAYEQRVGEVVSLAQSANYEEALAILQDILDQYRSRDHTGWLEHSILDHQALILARQGRLAEALGKHRLLAQKGFLEPSGFLSNQSAIARILDQSGQPLDAIRELEIGLERAQDTAIPGALGLLASYAQISMRLHRTVPARYRALLEGTGRWWGLRVADKLLNDPISLAAAILEADRLKREAQGRYEALDRNLREILKEPGREQKASEVLRAYVENEPVGFYRRLAADRLASLSELQRTSE